MSFSDLLDKMYFYLPLPEVIYNATELPKTSKVNKLSFYYCNMRICIVLFRDLILIMYIFYLKINLL